MKLKNIIPSLSLALLSGCVTVGCALRSPVPANRITVTTPSGGKYSVETPKNLDAQNFKLRAEADGALSVEAERWTSVNDPQVIDKATAGRVAETKALFDGFNGLAGKLVEGGVKGMK